MSTQFSHIFAGGYSAGYYSYNAVSDQQCVNGRLLPAEALVEQHRVFCTSFRQDIVADDVAGIFTGKTWKLTYITVKDSHQMFNFWGNDNCNVCPVPIVSFPCP